MTMSETLSMIAYSQFWGWEDLVAQSILSHLFDVAMFLKAYLVYLFEFLLDIFQVAKF